MRFEMEEGGQRILVVDNEKEIVCSTTNCTITDWNKMHFCSQNELIYCKDCLGERSLRNKKGCIPRKNHMDYKIDLVKVEKINPKHILNKELLEDE